MHNPSVFALMIKGFEHAITFNTLQSSEYHTISIASILPSGTRYQELFEKPKRQHH